MDWAPIPGRYHRFPPWPAALRTQCRKENCILLISSQQPKPGNSCKSVHVLFHQSYAVRIPDPTNICEIKPLSGPCLSLQIWSSCLPFRYIHFFSYFIDMIPDFRYIECDLAGGSRSTLVHPRSRGCYNSEPELEELWTDQEAITSLRWTCNASPRQRLRARQRRHHRLLDQISMKSCSKLDFWPGNDGLLRNTCRRSVETTSIKPYCTLLYRDSLFTRRLPFSEYCKMDRTPQEYGSFCTWIKNKSQLYEHCMSILWIGTICR